MYGIWTRLKQKLCTHKTLYKRLLGHRGEGENGEFLYRLTCKYCENAQDIGDHDLEKIKHQLEKKRIIDEDDPEYPLPRLFKELSRKEQRKIVENLTGGVSKTLAKYGLKSEIENARKTIMTAMVQYFDGNAQKERERRRQKSA